MIRPLSLYSPISVLLIMFDSWERIRAPTSSHTSAASKLPMNRWLLSFFIHGLPSLKKSDLQQCLMILMSYCEIVTCWAANSRALSIAYSLMEG